MPWLCVVALLAQSPDAVDPPVGVVRSSKRPGADAFASKMTARVLQSLVSAGYAGALDDGTTPARIAKGEDPRACLRAVECWRRVAGTLGPHGVIIAVDLGRVGQRLAVHLEAISVDAPEALAVVDFTASVGNVDDGSAPAIETFTRQLLAKLKPAAGVEPVEPAPVASVTRPAPRPSTAPGSSLAVPVGVAIGAAVIGALAATFTVLGWHEKQSVYAALANGGTVSTLPMSALEDHIRSGNTDYSVALAALIVAVALAATSAVLFATR